MVNAPPAMLEALATVPCRTVGAGNFHSVALARDDGGLYTWGEGRFGRLGHGVASVEVVPRLVSALLGVRVTTVACGGACTAAIDEAGVLWTWGSQTWGQCGHGSVRDDDELTLHGTPPSPSPPHHPV
jgi:alpha-tubulin suppressor-like RCC1 family protein